MARTKQTPRKGDLEKEKKVREPSKWGTAAEVAFHRPPVPPPRDCSGNPSYIGINVFNFMNLQSPDNKFVEILEYFHNTVLQASC